MADSAHTTVDPAEIERFSRIAGEWWDPAGKFAPLHRLNPLRIGYIRDRAAAHWTRDPLADLPLHCLSLLDIGCGGGLLSEPMARLGAQVTGVDAAARNVGVAALHAGKQGLEIDYRQGTAEALAEAGSRFDIVLALEIVEHVADVTTATSLPRSTSALTLRAAFRMRSMSPTEVPPNLRTMRAMDLLESGV